MKFSLLVVAALVQARVTAGDGKFLSAKDASDHGATFSPKINEALENLEKDLQRNVASLTQRERMPVFCKKFIFHSDVRTKLREVTRKLLRVNDDLVVERGHSKSLQEDNLALKNQSETLQKNNLALNMKIRELQQMNKKFENEHKNLLDSQHTVASLRAQLAALGAEDSSMKAQVHNFQNELSAERKEVAELNATHQKELKEAAVLHHEEQEVSAEKKELASDDAALEGLRTAGWEVRRMRDENAQLKKQTAEQLKQAADAWAKLNATTSKLRNDLDRYEGRNAAEEKEIHLKDVQLKMEVADLNEVTQQNYILKKNNTKLAHSLHRLRADSRALTKLNDEKLQTAQERVNALSGLVVNLTRTSSVEKRELQTELDKEAEIALTAKKEAFVNKKEADTLRQQIHQDEEKENTLDEKVKSMRANATRISTKLVSQFLIARANAQHKDKELKVALQDDKDLQVKLHKVEKQLATENSTIVEANKALKEALNATKLLGAGLRKFKKASQAKTHKVNELGAKLAKVEAMAQEKDQELKATLNGSQVLTAKLHAAELEVQSKEKSLEQATDDAKELRMELQVSDEAGKAVSENATKLRTDLNNAEVQIAHLSSTIKQRDQEIQRAGTVVHELEAKVHQVATKVEIAMKHKNVVLQEKSKQAQELAAKLHKAQVQLQSMRKIEAELKHLTKLRDELGTVSSVAAQQTQALRKFEVMDEQLRAEVNNAAAMASTQSQELTNGAALLEMPTPPQSKNKASIWKSVEDKAEAAFSYLEAGLR